MKGLKILFKSKGFSLVETIIYVSLLALLSVLIMSMIVSIINSQRNMKSHRAVEESAIVSLDRMIREIRDARSVDVSSVLGTHPGNLLLQTTNVSGNPRTVEFYLHSGVLTMKENGNAIGPLSKSEAVVNNLVFRLMDRSNADAIKIELTISTGEGRSHYTENFYATAVLRGSY